MKPISFQLLGLVDMSHLDHRPAAIAERRSWPWRLARRFRLDRRGGVAAVAALSLPVMIGTTGIAVDVGTWYHAKRTIQSAADAAAFAGALDLARQGLDGSATFPPIDAAARDASARNGFGGTMTVNHPPTSGAFSGNDRAVEVIVQQPASVFFASLFMDRTPTVSARAVGMAIVADACVWALHPTQRAALSVSGSASIGLGCGVVVNSTHDEAALDQSGSSCLQSTSIALAGGWAGSCVDPQPEQLAADFGDPFSDVPTPEASACDQTSKIRHTSGTLFLTPGRYCGGIDISGGEVVFEPGEYILDGDGIKVSGNAIISGSDVTFLLTGSGNKYAQIDIASGSDVQLSAPTSGDNAHMLFIQDPNAPSNVNNKFTGGSSMDLQGVIYFPTQSVEFAGGSASDRSRVLLAASTVSFSGSAYLDSNYAKNLLPNSYVARLVE